MLNEAFVSRLADLGVRAAGPVVQTIPGGPAHQFLLRGADGTYSTEEVAEHPLEHCAYDIGSLVRKAEELFAGKGDVWYSREEVKAVRGRDQVKLDLSYSPQLALLQDWAENNGVLDQSRLVYILRTTLAGCFPQFSALLDLVRRVDIKKGQEIASQIDKGKVSVSRSMVADALGADKLPDAVTFAVPIWAEASMQAIVKGVTVAFDLDAQAEKFILTPLPGSIEKAIGQAEDALGARLADAAGPDTQLAFYYGQH